MVNLPYDVWFHIVQFIPPDEVRNLLSVNRPLFELAMNERYRSLMFRYTEGVSTACSESLRDPSITQRVRSLSINCNGLGRCHWPRPITQKTWLTNLCLGISRLIHPQNALLQKLPLRLYDHYTQVFLDAVGRLSNVTEYNIDWCDNSFNQGPLPFVLAFLFAFPDNLVTLDLYIGPIEFCRIVKESPNLMLKHLEILSVVFKSYHHKDRIIYPQGVTDDLCSLVGRVGGTLRSLRIWSPLHINFSPFFYDIQFLPSLNRLDLGILLDGVHLPDPSGLINFLNHHSDNLRHFSLSNYEQCRSIRCDKKGSFPWLHLSQVMLEHLLTFDVFGECFASDEAISMLRMMCSPLTSLTINGNRIPYQGRSQ